MIGVLALVLALGVAFAFGQGHHGGKKGMMGGMMKDKNSEKEMYSPCGMFGKGPDAMEIAGDSVFIVRGIMVYKVGAMDMKLKTKMELPDMMTLEETRIDALMKECDKNNDQKITREECGAPSMFFEHMDADGNGFVTRKELMNSNGMGLGFGKMRGMMMDDDFPMGPMFGHMGRRPTVKAMEDSLFICVGGVLYKLKQSDLSVENTFSIK